MLVELRYSDNVLLSLLNSYEYPGLKARVHLVTGPEGQIAITVRPVEAWDRWARFNGYDDTDEFMETVEKQVSWFENYHVGVLPNGSSLRIVDVEGYYRDGKEYL